MNIIIITVMVLGSIGGVIYYGWRGIVQGIGRREIVVRDVLYREEMAKRWGVISIGYSILFVVLGAFSVSMLIEQLH